MNTLTRTLITFAAFVVTYFLVVKVHQDASGMDSLQHVVVWLVFVIMTIVSVHQWEASYLFGSFVLVYLAMIAMKVGLAKETLLALVTTILMGLALAQCKISEIIRWESVKKGGVWGMNIFGNLFERFSRNRRLARLQALAGVKAGGNDLSEPMLEECAGVETDVRKVAAFFDGSDPALEKTLKGTTQQIEGLQKDHARLVFRSVHLGGLIKSEPREALEKAIAQISGEAGLSKDSVEKAQLLATIEMKKNRLAELERLEICLKRVDAQRLQIIDAIQATFHKLNSLKYSDIQTLEASRDAISEPIRQIRSDLDDMHDGLLAAEGLTRK